MKLYKTIFAALFLLSFSVEISATDLSKSENAAGVEPLDRPSHKSLPTPVYGASSSSENFSLPVVPESSENNLDQGSLFIKHITIV